MAWGGEGAREGVRGSERGTDSVPTLLITVSLETERGLPLALGNSLGPVAERGAAVGGGREGDSGGEGREGRVELKRVYDTGTLSIILFSLVLPHCVHTRGEPLHHESPPLLCPNTPHLSPPTHFSLTLPYPPPTSVLSFPSAFVHHRVLLPFYPHTLFFFLPLYLSAFPMPCSSPVSPVDMNKATRDTLK